MRLASAPESMPQVEGDGNSLVAKAFLMPSELGFLVRHGGKVRAQSVLRLSSYSSVNDRRLQFGLGRGYLSRYQGSLALRLTTRD